MKRLELETIEPDGFTKISLDDERDRATAGEIDERAVASIAFASERPGEESTWDQFLTLPDVLALHAWTGAILTDHHGDGPPPASR
jgi:hypothetical protein